MNPILSFIVPCYNVERYLQECLDSIYVCSLPDEEYEILCIDDCSPDGSLNILKRNAEVHANLRIVSHEVNRGLGGARNTGIREAKGKYLWFVDSDDYLSLAALPKMLDLCSANNLDVLAFNYREVDETRRLIRDTHVFHDETVSDGCSFVKKVFGRNFVNHAGYVVRFIYSVDFLKHTQLYFPEKVYWEDTVYMPKSVLLANRVQSVSDICYNYRRNAASISGQYHKQYRAELICQMAFCAGRDLLDYSNEIPDKELSDAFRKKAISMINGFKIHLLRTSGTQRRRFYHILDEFQVENLKPQMTAESKFCLNRFFGRMFVGVLAWVYGVKHKK